jgi:murein DD-endopeptidase MepM/ murein hydrolase activator NlpD
VFAQNPVTSWGGIVLLRADAATVQHAADMTGIVMDVLDVQYAHLLHVTVTPGDTVRAGDHLGSIGKGTFDQYIAHLHLEMRRTKRNAAEGQGSSNEALADAKNHYLDPLAIMAALKLSDYGCPEA